MYFEAAVIVWQPVAQADAQWRNLLAGSINIGGAIGHRLAKTLGVFMPIELYYEADDLRVRQSFRSPSVYLDHWAICTFSDDAALQQRLITAVHDRNVTFLLSHTNLAEFTSPSDIRHALAAETFFDRLLPNVYMTDFDLEAAEEWEANPQTRDHRICPSPDLPMLKFLAQLSLKTGNGITFQGFVRLSHEHRESIGAVFRQVNENILQAINQQRADPIFLRKAKASVPGENRTKTRVVMGELIRELTIDPRAEVTINDVVDWQHAVLPVLCCDYVLLDQKWEQRVKTLKRRCAANSLPISLAQCFSAKDHGVQRFLEALELCPQKPNPALKRTDNSGAD